MIRECGLEVRQSPGGEIIDDIDPVPEVEKMIDEMGTDESRPPSDQHML